MKHALRAAGAAIVMLGGVAATPAWAACGDLKQAAAYEDNGSAGRSALFHQADWDDGRGHSIVGMWQFRMMAGGQLADFGYQQWHSDGTELMNSGGRSPAIENFCMGVWKQTSEGRYHLNHFALSYDTSGTLNARINIKEDVTVDRRNATYSGRFTLDAYDPKSNALLQHVAGTVTAQRVAAD